MFKKNSGSVKFIKAPAGFKLKAFRFVVNTLTHLYCCLYIYIHTYFLYVLKIMGQSYKSN